MKRFFRTLPRLGFVLFLSTYVPTSADHIARYGWASWFLVSGFTFVWFGIMFAWGYFSATMEA